MSALLRVPLHQFLRIQLLQQMQYVVGYSRHKWSNYEVLGPPPFLSFHLSYPVPSYFVVFLLFGNLNWNVIFPLEMTLTCSLSCLPRRALHFMWQVQTSWLYSAIFLLAWSCLKTFTWLPVCTLAAQKLFIVLSITLPPCFINIVPRSQYATYPVQMMIVLKLLYEGQALNGERKCVSKNKKTLRAGSMFVLRVLES